MTELSGKQQQITEKMKSLLHAPSPWVLRVAERKDFTGPVLEVCERRPTNNGTKKLYEYGRIYNGHLRVCKEPIRRMMSQVTDPDGRPLELQGLIDDKLAFRGQIPLDEITGAKLALLFKLHPQVRDDNRIELMAWRIERFGREETLYWLSKVSIEGLYKKRGIEWAKSGLRLMLAGQQKDRKAVEELLQQLRR